MPIEETTTDQIQQMLDKAKKLHLWKGSLGEKIEKFKIIHNEINRITGKNIKLRLNLDAFESSEENSGASNWDSATNTITLHGKLSVITLIHEWGHALGLNEVDTSEWSNRIFQKSFPRSWERLHNQPHEGAEEGDTFMVKIKPERVKI